LARTIRNVIFEPLSCLSCTGCVRSQFEGGFEIVRPASGVAPANPVPGRFFGIVPASKPVAHDLPAVCRDGVDRPGRPFGHDELASSAQRQSHAASGDPCGGFSPQTGEKSRPEVRAAEDIAVDGRILPPAGHVAFELGGGDAFESRSGCQRLLVFHFERLALERCQLHADAREFADQASLVIAGRPEAVTEVSEDPFESRAIGLGDEGIAFEPFDRAIFFEDVAGFEAHQNDELFQYGVVIDLASRVHGISGRCRTDNAIKNRFTSFADR